MGNCSKSCGWVGCLIEVLQLRSCHTAGGDKDEEQFLGCDIELLKGNGCEGL